MSTEDLSKLENLSLNEQETNPENKFEDTIESTKKDIANLLQLIASRQKKCDELNNETEYMKQYVASFISSGDLKR